MNTGSKKKANNRKHKALVEADFKHEANRMIAGEKAGSKLAETEIEQEAKKRKRPRSKQSESKAAFKN